MDDILIYIIVLVVIWIVLRVVLKLTMKLFAIGCSVLLLLAALVFLAQYFGS